MSFIQGIFNLFKSEKKYLLMLIFIIVFFGLSVFMKGLSKKSETFVSLQSSVKAAEEVMEANSEDPNYLKERLEHDPALNRCAQFFMVFALIALTIGIYIDVGLIMKTTRKEPWLQKSEFQPEVGWGFHEIFKVIILFLFFGICLDFLFLFFMRWVPPSFRSNFLLIMHTTITDIAIVGFILYFLDKTQEQTALAALGFRNSINWIEEVWLGVKGYLAILPVFMLMMALLIFVTSALHYEPPAHPLVGIFIEEEKRAPWLIGYSLFLACVVGPIVEEIFFRGFLYPVIRKKWGIPLASMSTAALFALTHENAFAFAPIFLLGLVLSYLYEKRGSLISCMSLHVLHNTIFITYFFLIKQILLDHKVG